MDYVSDHSSVEHNKWNQMADAMEFVKNLPHDENFWGIFRRHRQKIDSSWSFGGVSVVETAILQGNISDPVLRAEIASPQNRNVLSNIEVSCVNTRQMAAVKGSLDVDGHTYRIFSPEKNRIRIQGHSGHEADIEASELNGILLSFLLGNEVIDTHFDRMSYFLNELDLIDNDWEKLTTILKSLGNLLGESIQRNTAVFLDPKDKTKAFTSTVDFIETPDDSEVSHIVQVNQSTELFTHGYGFETTEELSAIQKDSSFSSEEGYTELIEVSPINELIIRALLRSTVHDERADATFFRPEDSPEDAIKYGKVCLDFMDFLRKIYPTE